MKRKNKAITIKLLSVVLFIVSVVIIAHNAPKQQTEPKQEQVENVIYEDENPQMYRYDKTGATGSLERDPTTGKKGTPIDAETYEKLKQLN